MSGFFSSLMQEHFLAVMLGGATLCNILWLGIYGKRIRVSLPAAVLIALLHVAAGVLAVKAFAGLESGRFDGSAGMSLFGSVFLMPLLYYAGAKLFKRPMGETFDLMTFCLVISLTLARINCLPGGCCLGRVIPGLAPARFPTREAELVFNVAFLVWMIATVARKRERGQIYPAYLFCYGVFRFVCEFFRDKETTQLFHLSHLWAFLAIAAGAACLLENGRSKKNRK